MEKTSFDLEANAAAIVFHSDMGTELILPKMDDEETVDFESNQNIFVAMAVVSLLDDDGFRKYVQTKLETMFETSEALREDNENPTSGCPSGGCGSCAGHEVDPGDGS